MRETQTTRKRGSIGFEATNLTPNGRRRLVSSDETWGLRNVDSVHHGEVDTSQVLHDPRVGRKRSARWSGHPRSRTRLHVTSREASPTTTVSKSSLVWLTTPWVAATRNGSTTPLQSGPRRGNHENARALRSVVSWTAQACVGPTRQRAATPRALAFRLKPWRHEVRTRRPV